MRHGLSTGRNCAQGATPPPPQGECCCQFPLPRGPCPCSAASPRVAGEQRPWGRPRSRCQRPDWYTSANFRGPLLNPPEMRTLPLGSSVAVCSYRDVAMEPAAPDTAKLWVAVRLNALVTVAVMVAVTPAETQPGAVQVTRLVEAPLAGVPNEPAVAVHANVSELDLRVQGGDVKGHRLARRGGEGRLVEVGEGGSKARGGGSGNAQVERARVLPAAAVLNGDGELTVVASPRRNGRGDKGGGAGGGVGPGTRAGGSPRVGKGIAINIRGGGGDSPTGTALDEAGALSPEAPSGGFDSRRPP